MKKHSCVCSDWDDKKSLSLYFAYTILERIFKVWKKRYIT